MQFFFVDVESTSSRPTLGLDVESTTSRLVQTGLVQDSSPGQDWSTGSGDCQSGQSVVNLIHVWLGPSLDQEGTGAAAAAAAGPQAEVDIFFVCLVPRLWPVDKNLPPTDQLFVCCIRILSVMSEASELGAVCDPKPQITKGKVVTFAVGSTNPSKMRAVEMVRGAPVPGFACIPCLACDGYRCYGSITSLNDAFTPGGHEAVPLRFDGSQGCVCQGQKVRPARLRLSLCWTWCVHEPACNLVCNAVRMFLGSS